MKKVISIIICAVMVLGVFTACSGNKNANTDSGKLKIITTIFPEYDWVRNIAGDKADITMLLDNGVDLHSYQPTADDIIKISTCDVFVYVGGESDSWVKDTLKETVNKDMVVLNLLDLLGENAKEEDEKECMQEEEHEHEEESEKEGPEYDEHVWLSLRNAAVLCQKISDALCKKDAANSEFYKSNTTAYIEKLNSLDSQYKDAVNAAKQKTVLFGDRFPFRYLTDDYGLDYYAAFVGCSAETEASFETIMFLAHKVDELGLTSIMQIETSDGSIAETIRKNTKTNDQNILTVDSLQSVTAKDVESGTTYLSVMEKNLEVLKDALK